MRSPALRGVLVSLLVLALFAAGGAFGGWLWERTTPPVRGVAYQHRFLVVGGASARQFAATGHYVVIAAVIGIVLGAAIALMVRGHELVTLVAVTVASVGAALVMAWVGHHLGPPDPVPLARAAKDFTRLPQDLRVQGLPPYAALPAGAMLGLLAGLVGLELFGGFAHRRSVGMTTLNDVSSF